VVDIGQKNAGSEQLVGKKKNGENENMWRME